MHDIFGGISKGYFQIPHNTLQPYIERYDFDKSMKLHQAIIFKELLDIYKYSYRPSR